MKSAKELVAEANLAVKAVTAAEAIHLLKDPDTVFVDLRDSSELQIHGKISGAVHANRGMLEFFIDPASSLHNPVFASGKKLLFYCAGGGRSVGQGGAFEGFGLPEFAGGDLGAGEVCLTQVCAEEFDTVELGAAQVRFQLLDAGCGLVWIGLGEVAEERRRGPGEEVAPVRPGAVRTHVHPVVVVIERRHHVILFGGGDEPVVANWFDTGFRVGPGRPWVVSADAQSAAITQSNF